MARRLILLKESWEAGAGDQFTLGRYAEYPANVSVQTWLVHPYAGVIGPFFHGAMSCIRGTHCGGSVADRKLL